MDTTVVHVRDLPTDVVATLKARSQARGQSLAAYLRDLLTDDAKLAGASGHYAVIESYPQ